MKEIKILTFCTYSSIGSILQALGLTKALQTVQCHGTLWLERCNPPLHTDRVRSLKSLITILFQALICKQRKCAHQKRLDFIAAHISTEERAYDDTLPQIAQHSDAVCFLAGSDQIWNPRLCNPAFFLDFADGKKRISYAASMGVTEVPAENEALFRRLVNNFDCISVREQECADVIRRYTDREISVHIDPTFLVSADEWRTYEETYPIRQPYILLYMLYWDNSCKEKIQELKKKTRLPVYAIADGLSRVRADRFLFDVGVGEFLWLIDHAEYVVTSSFHGTAFSIIFNKRFAAVANPSAPSRIHHLVRLLEIPHTDIAELPDAALPDYDEVNRRICQQRDISLQYLKQATEDSV